jgi:DNA (cytosine-5)-methyltransferase 1
MNEYLKITAAANLLGVAKNTLINWEKAGKLKTFRHPISGYRFYKREDLYKILQDIDKSSNISELVD